MARMFEKAVFVIGSTAVGKTKLGIDIAKRLNGEIISTDSMQIYQKASLMTAKPTAEEQLEIKHHLIDLMPLSKTDFSVREYQELALNAVNDIISRGKTPVFVGGTMYYVESLLFSKDYPHENPSPDIPDSEILQKLQNLDPAYLNSSDSNPRHLRNAYFHYLATGQKPSERSSANQLRFNHSVIIWLHCSLEILEQRVRQRIEKMIQSGGLAEIEEILQDIQCDFTKGVLQSIGYKEFEPFLTHKSSLEACINRLVLSTMQYSKKQVRWIKNRLENYLKVHKICTDNAEDWEKIKELSFEALAGSAENGRFELPKLVVRDCSDCGVTLRGESEWLQHQRSKAHKKKKELQVSDDEEVRLCEVCEKTVQGKRNWLLHHKSKKHIRKNKKK